LTELDSFELAPAFTADGRSIVFAAWNDDEGGALYRVSARGGRAKRIHAAPTQLANPSISPDGKSIVFVRGSGANLRGQDLGSELRHDLFVMHRFE
jgi:Tol biopolymer transport system component